MLIVTELLKTELLKTGLLKTGLLKTGLLKTGLLKTRPLKTEMLVTEQAGTCPVARHPGLWDRIMARTCSFSLDRDLARGVSPEGSVRLALRARRLTGMRERRMFAQAIRHLLDTTTRLDSASRRDSGSRRDSASRLNSASRLDGSSRLDRRSAQVRPPVTICRDRVQAASREFEALAARLLSPAPVPAYGMAQTSILLHDGGGPLYRRGSRDDLPARVHQAVESLDTLARW
jgi:hypothetical protein